MNLYEHLKRQIAFSRATFGPGERTAGVIDHIRKEVGEVVFAADPRSRAEEWVDVVILALDGLTRALVEDLLDKRGQDWPCTSSYASDQACMMIERKQSRNEMRTWPDWRTADPTKAIEHDRSGE